MSQFPELNVEYELRAAEMWMRDRNASPANGVVPFVERWLARSADRALKQRAYRVTHGCGFCGCNVRNYNALLLMVVDHILKDKPELVIDVASEDMTQRVSITKTRNGRQLSITRRDSGQSK
ncbi:MAG: hypothetical protein NTW87_11550 [Planctomycetota bacterium]|nr:hypothetical protein [Planctomycetota bacterium]